ncbi:MAG: beta-propeller fold lactonase family protein, partial [Myxococcales bacterium]
AFTKDGSTGFISNEFGGTLTAFDPRTNQVLGTVKIEAKSPVGERPMGLALSPDDKQLYVTTGRGGAIAIVDVGKHEMTGLIEGVGARPWGLAVSSDGKHAYTANGSSDDISIVDVASGKVEKKVTIGGLPWGVITGETR